MHDIIISTTEKLFKNECTKELIDESEKQNLSFSLWEKVEEIGITFIGIDESVGGVGGDAFDTFEMMKLTGKYALPLPLFETIFAKWILVEHGALDLPEGMHTFMLNKEKDLTVIEEAGKYYVTGNLVHVPWGRLAQSIIAFANLEGQPVLIQISNQHINKMRVLI